MKASRTDQPRTSPVALRTKTARSSNGAPAAPLATDAMSVDPPSSWMPRAATCAAASRSLAACQHEPLDLLAVLDVDHRPQELSLLVGAAGVDAERAPQALG